MDDSKKNIFLQQGIAKKIGMAVGGVIVIAILAAIIFPNPLGYDIRLITKLMSLGVTLTALLIFGSFIYRAVTLKRWRKVRTIFLTILLIIVVGFNLVINAGGVMINQLLDRRTFASEEIDKLTNDAKALTEQMEAEGIVLLKNKDNALPLANKNINVFGYSSNYIVYGGAGSGAADETKNVSLQTALKNKGFTLNEDLMAFYNERIYKKKATNVLEMLGADYNIPESPVSEYSTDLISKAKAFSDTALVIIARKGGEGADMPTDMAEYTGGKAGQHYMELTDNEKDLLKMAGENFKNVVVGVNSSAPMNLGVLDENYITGAVWIGGPGSTGLNALGSVLSGEVNPSGRLGDTYAYDVKSAPAFLNSGAFAYTGSEFEETALLGKAFSSDTPRRYFVNYKEGIYVGYRYYETAAADGYIDYAKTVQYPFGYGLSYTTFEQKMGNLVVNGDKISVDVTVTNTGNKAGKEVVQLYYTPPYTKGGIEKAHVNLLAFDKTDIVAPGKSQVIKLTFDKADMCSYDYKNAKAYVRETGNYAIKLMKNSHEVIDSRNYFEVRTLSGEAAGRDDIATATNQFDDAASDIQYVSRADWAGTMPKQMATEVPVTEELKAALGDISIDIDEKAEPIVVKNHGIKLADMKGLPYDDPKWDEFMEQISVKDMTYLLGTGGWQTPHIRSIGKPQTSDIDGPAGLNGLINGVMGNQYTSEVVIANTWNTDIVEQFGELLGKEAYAKKVNGIYGPSMNIHRQAFGGRNFEYYSEDGFLSGKMGAATVRGTNKTNTYTYVKHFALYDQETHAQGISVWSNEQAIREIYLKPYELTVKEGGTKAIMSAWNRIGTTWTGASKALLTNVLRDEWGFEGMVITDNAMVGSFMSPDQAAEAGNDLLLSSIPLKFADTESATAQQNLRKSSKNVLFTMANSNAFELARVGVPSWVWVAVLVNSILLALAAHGFVIATREKKKRVKKNKKTDIAVE